MAPPARCPTTVLDLDDDLLREVFLRLPALPSLVRATLSCRTFLRAARSSPAFRRRFRELHPSPFVGLFIQRLLKGWEPEASSFDAHHTPSDRDFEAAVRGGDFSLAGLPLPDGDNQDSGDDDCIDQEEENNEEEDENNEDEEDGDEEDEESEEEDENNQEEEDGYEEEEEDGDEEEEEEDGYEEEDEEEEEEQDDEDASPVWEIERCCDGYVILFNRRAKKIAAYNPLTRALHLFPTPPNVFSEAVNYEFHIIFSQEDPASPMHLVCFYSGFFEAVIGIISSDDNAESKWHKFPETAIGVTGKMVNGSVYWTHVGKPYMTVLDTATLQFTKMDLPPLLAEQDDRECAFVLGNTKDGRPCIVSPGLWGGCSLNVYFWRREDGYFDDGLNYWILDQTFHLKTIGQFIKFSDGDDEFISVRLIDVIDGVVYLRTEYDGCTEAPQMLLSFCLETAELTMICEDYHKPIHPYVMAWPPSLVLDKGPCSKDEALSTLGSEGSDVKAEGGPTEHASVAKD